MSFILPLDHRLFAVLLFSSMFGKMPMARSLLLRAGCKFCGAASSSPPFASLGVATFELFRRSLLSFFSPAGASSGSGAGPASDSPSGSSAMLSAARSPPPDFFLALVALACFIFSTSFAEASSSPSWMLNMGPNLTGQRSRTLSRKVEIFDARSAREP